MLFTRLLLNFKADRRLYTRIQFDCDGIFTQFLDRVGQHYLLFIQFQTGLLI